MLEEAFDCVRECRLSTEYQDTREAMHGVSTATIVITPRRACHAQDCLDILARVRPNSCCGEAAMTQTLNKPSELEPADEVDVLIVGAGFSGLYQLHHLRRAGFKVK